MEVLELDCEDDGSYHLSSLSLDVKLLDCTIKTSPQVIFEA